MPQPSAVENLSSKYDAQAVESRLYEEWEKAGYFRADPAAPGEPFSIVIPPPNVTGILHIGHALNGTIQDILIRWRRMQGRNTLWLPGMDHAGIATQHVVERQLREEGIEDPRGMGREKFIARVWEWKEHHGSAIIGQLKSLGCSCDWSRERFTMDDGLSRAVRQVFKRLFDEGLIYRGDYMVNWSPKLQTALSDDEVEHRDVEGSLWYFRYPYSDGSGHAVVATTRPETMLGDTAVAVNPDDERYKDLVGKRCMLPLMNREIPIIADTLVSTEFGTGMVKVTPAHDPNDYEMGKRHDLEFINILHPDGRLNDNAGKYAGLDVEEGRRRVVEDMKAEGLLEKIEPHTHSVGHCYRSGCVVEPFISKQWFVKMRPLAEPAIEAVRDGRIEFVPGSWDRTYFRWLENVRDWCISRQLWWGHRIPVFTCEDCENVASFVEDAPERCEKCDSGRLVQDPDVLDTWFSSALWPFSTMGWPDKTADLERYYPTSVLVTGHDIIFFWVARMIMMGLKCMEEAPFRQVFITPLIMDEHGAKMSKSKGNAIDPLEIVGRYGADTVRLTLASHSAQGRQVSLSMKRFEGYRDFTNKLWNAARLVLMNVEDLGADDLAGAVGSRALQLEDRWILSLLRGVCERATRSLERYEFDEYLSSIYDFTWNQYCAWYLEMVKPRLYSKGKEDYDESAQASRTTAQIVLVTVLENVLRLLHPVAPFISEEIWQKLKARWPETARGAANHSVASLSAESIMIAPWPRTADVGSSDVDAEERVGLLQEVVYRVRKIRGEMDVPPSTKTELEIVCADAERRAKLDETSAHFHSLLNLSELSFVAEPTEMAFSSTSVFEDVTVRVPLPEELRTREAERLDKEIGRMAADLERIQAKLANEKFTSRAPAEIVERERDRLETQAEELATLKSKRLDLG